MKVLKLLVVLLIASITTIVLVVAWIYRLAQGQPNAAVDIAYVTLRPLFLLEFTAIVALAAWVYWRWAFR